MNDINRHAKLTLFAITTLFYFTIASCEYNENEIFERNLDTNVTPPNIETVYLDLASDQDTVDLLYNRIFFSFKSSNQKIKFVIFFIDGDSVGTANSNKGYFDLNYQFLYVGTHKLKIELFTSSGTGSIADSVNAEGFLFTTKEWVIKVHNTSYSNVTTTVANGFLKLRWPKPYENASEYIIYRNYTEIGRTTDCEFIDKGHVGEATDYYVKYISPYTGDLTTLGWVDVPKEMNLKFTADKNNNYTVNWGNLKYYAAIGSITIRSCYTNSFFDGYAVETTTDISKTGFQIPTSYFGQVRKYQMILLPKYPNPLNDPSVYDRYAVFGSPFFEFVIGYPFPIFQNFMHVSNSEILYHTNMYDHSSICYDDTIYRYSLTENKIVDRYRYNMPDYEWSDDHYRYPTISPNGNYYFATTVYENTVVIGSANNLSNCSIVDLSNTLTYYNLKIPISNVGTGIICGSSKKYLYDFINDCSLGYIEESVNPYDYNLSPDGKYIFISFWHTINMYEYNNDTITYIGQISDAADYFHFINNDPHKAIGWNASSKILKVYNCPDLSVIKSFSLPEDDILDVDYLNNRILSFSPYLLVVRSLTDGSIQYQIPVSFSYATFNKCYLSGNSIFHQNGARYFLN